MDSTCIGTAFPTIASLLPLRSLFMRPATHSMLAAAAALLGGPCLAQTAPVNGIRPAEVRTHAIVGATVVVRPGRTIENATVVIRDGVIEAVGPEVPVPAHARAHDGEGLTV